MHDDASFQLAAVQALADALFTTDLEGHITSWNPGAERLFGYTRADAGGRSRADLFPPDRQEAIEQAWSQANRGKTPPAIETICLHKDGQRFRAILSVSPLTDGVGRIMGTAGIVRVPDELERLALQRFARAYDALGVGAWHWDSQDDVLIWTEGNYDLMGVRREVMPSWDAILAVLVPEDRARVNAEFARALREQRPDWATDYRVVHPARGLRWLQGSAKIAYGADGKPNEMVGITIDITERKQAEAAEQEARTRLENILESISDAFYALDAHWRFTYINRKAEQLWGRAREDLLGRVIWEEFRNTVGTEIFQAHLRVAQERRTESLEHISPVLGIWLSTSINPAPDGGLTVFFRDVSARKRGEEMLRASEARARVITENASFLVSLVGPDGRTTYVNKAWRDFLGVPDDARTYADINQGHYTHPEDRERLRVESNTARAKGEARSLEFRMRRYDGVYRWFTGMRRPFPNEKGEIEGFIGSYVDITERKDSEEALRRREAELREAQRLARLGSFTYDLATSTYMVSDEFRRIYGRGDSLPEKGANLWEGHPMHTPEDYARILAATRQAILEKAPYALEVGVLRPDGTARTVLVRGEPVLGSNGRVSLLRGTVLDITERKQAEDAERATRQELESILESISDGFYAVDKDWRFTYVNKRAEARWGKKREELLGNVLDDEFPQAKGAPARQMLETVARERQPHSMEHISPVTGTWTHTTFYPAANGGITAFVQDIEERKRAEMALQEADRRKDQFLATLSHELRNPLAALRSAVEVLHLSQDDPQITPGVLPILDTGIAHLTHLVNDLLDVSRLQRGRITLQKELLTVQDVLGKAREIVQPQLSGKHQELSLALPPEPIAIEGDLTRLVQVFTNLLDNAAKFTPNGGHIAVTVEATQQDVIVRVQDTGQGISAEFLPHVFDPFTQETHQSASTFGGLGLGLPVVKSLVELHGGSVRAESPGPGQGSTFTVHLPRRVRVPPPTVVMKEPVTPAQSLRIFLVEDNDATGEAMALLLRRLGHTVERVLDGETALQRVEPFQPHVIFLDIGLPGMNGYQVAQHLRRKEGLQGVTMIALTGYGMEGDRRQAKEAGFDFHITKPVSLTTLQKTLGDISAKR